MEKRRAKSNTKRQRKNDGKNGESKQRKMPRLASPPPPVESAEITKIIDLNDDCLVKIFGHLDVQDLFNVATSNAFLRPAACEVYKQKFGKMRVSIEEVAKFRPNTRAAARNDCSNKSFAPKFDDNGEITVRELKISLRYLRYFGSCITDLSVYYGKTASNSKRYAYVYQYINDYCAESLLHFGFYFMPTNATIEQFQKVFTNVRAVTIFGNCSVLQNPSFVNWFPELRDLKLFGVRDYVPTMKPFQHLEALFIVENCCDEFATERIAADLLNGVHQLKILYIDHHYDKNAPALPLRPFDTWLDVIKGQSSILILSVDNIGEMTTADVQQLVKDHSALVALHLSNYRLKIGDAIALVRQLNSLGEFQFQMLDSERLQLVSQLDGEWKATYDYIDAYPHHVLVSLSRKM